MEDGNAITPQTITELKQVPPEQIAKISEEVLEADRVIHKANEELEHLSACINNLSITKSQYDEVSGKVKKQMRQIVTKL